MSDQEIPRYRCHKEVRALKIVDRCYQYLGRDEIWTDSRLKVDPDAPQRPVAEYGLSFVDHEPIWVGVTWIARHNPQPGGYLVIYEDGYRSYSPAKAFEEGYTLISLPAKNETTGHSSE